MKRYVVTEKYGVIDTHDTKKYNHVECFVEKGGELFVEDVLGNFYSYSEIIDQFDNWKEVQ